MNAQTPRITGSLVPTAAPEVTEFTFMFGDQAIRGLAFGDKPIFVAADVAEALQYRDAGNMNRILKAKERGTHTVSTPGGPQRMSTITEPGLYRAIMQRKIYDDGDVARRLAVEKFQDWVVEEVLPTIRRKGSYTTAPLPIPEPVQIDVRDRGQLAVIASQLVALTAELQAELGHEREAHAETHQHLEDTTKLLRIESNARQVTSSALAEAHVRIEAQRPAVIAQARIAASDECLSASEAAVILRVPRTAVIEHLLKLGYITHVQTKDRLRMRCLKNGVDSGWVRQGPYDVELPAGGIATRFHPVVTPVGMAGLTEHFCRGVQATRQPVIPGV